MSKLEPSFNPEELFEGKKDKPQASESSNKSPKTSPNKSTQPEIKSPGKSPTKTPTENLKTTFVLPPPTPVITKKEQAQEPPRFDWIQKTDSINVIFYTKPLSNPEVQITRLKYGENAVEVKITLDRREYTNTLTFQKGIFWPGKVKVNYETGKIELVINKAQSKIWENYGELEQKINELSSREFKFPYRIISKVQLTHDTYLLETERIDGVKLAVPIGRHVRVFMTSKGEEFSRSYTPVPYSSLGKFKPSSYTADNVSLIVKNYKDGKLSKYICGKGIGDTLELTKSLGSFRLGDLEGREVFLLVAAGTGLTPMLGLLLFLLERRTRKW